MAVTGRRVTATPDTIKSPSSNNPTATANSPGSNTSGISRDEGDGEPSSPGTKYQDAINSRRRVNKIHAGGSKSAFFVHEVERQAKDIEIQDRPEEENVKQNYEHETL